MNIQIEEQKTKHTGDRENTNTMLSLSTPVAVGGTNHKSPVLSMAATSNAANGLVSAQNHAIRTGMPNGVTASHGNSRPSGRGRVGNCHHIWLVTGPAGSGKSTLAQFLAKSLNLPYVEGDNVRL